MIIKSKTGDDVLVEGESDIKKATISERKLQKLQHMLTSGLYEDGISATITELTNNAVDSHIQAGKDPLEHPVMVEIGTYKNGTHFFKVTDVGLGLNKDEFENTLMCYLESTKEDDNTVTGFFGIGSKSWLSLERSATFICRKDGVELKYLCYQGSEFLEYDLLYTKDTEEQNGVIFEVEIKDRMEKVEFSEKAKERLSYYDTVVLLIDGVPFENTIYRQEDFQWSDNSGLSEIHITLKDVLYRVNWSKLGISRINTPVALRFNLEDGLLMVPSRESLIYTEEVKKIILGKIKKVADWFGKKYNEGIVEFDNFCEAFKHLGNHQKFLEIEGNQFYIDGLEQYMSFSLEDIKVKGIEHPRKAYTSLNDWTSNFTCIGNIDWKGTYKTKNLYTYISQMMSYNYKAVLLDQHPVGRVKDFLKQKYERDTYFLLEKKPSLSMYKTMLRLNSVEKTEWRGKIKQVQELHKQVKEGFFTALNNIRESKEFLKFEEEQKAIAKANKTAGIEGTYKILDKQEGEVTIAFGRRPVTGDVPVFEKNTYVIDELYKTPGIILLFSEEEKEEAKNYYGLHKNLKTAIIGKREKTKLPEIHQIMEKEKFEKTKLFKRIVTAMRIEDILNSWYKITGSKEDITENYIDKLSYTKKKLETYKSENFQRTNLSREAKDSFLALAHQYNLWDEEIMSNVKRMEKAVNTFYFLEYVEIPRYGSEEDVKKVKRIINQLLIFQKKYGAFDNYELVEKELPVEQLEEQLELEEEFLNTPEAEMCMA